MCAANKVGLAERVLWLMVCVQAAVEVRDGGGGIGGRWGALDSEFMSRTRAVKQLAVAVMGGGGGEEALRAILKGVARHIADGGGWDFDGGELEEMCALERMDLLTVLCGMDAAVLAGAMHIGKHVCVANTSRGSKVAALLAMPELDGTGLPLAGRVLLLLGWDAYKEWFGATGDGAHEADADAGAQAQMELALGAAARAGVVRWFDGRLELVGRRVAAVLSSGRVAARDRLYRQFMEGACGDGDFIAKGLAAVLWHVVQRSEDTFGLVQSVAGVRKASERLTGKVELYAAVIVTADGSGGGSRAKQRRYIKVSVRRRGGLGLDPAAEKCRTLQGRLHLADSRRMELECQVECLKRAEKRALKYAKLYKEQRDAARKHASRYKMERDEARQDVRRPALPPDSALIALEKEQGLLAVAVAGDKCHCEPRALCISDRQYLRTRLEDGLDYGQVRWMVYAEIVTHWEQTYKAIAAREELSEIINVDEYLQRTVLGATFPRHLFDVAYATSAGATLVKWRILENGGVEIGSQIEPVRGVVSKRRVSLLHHKNHFWALVDAGAEDGGNGDDGGDDNGDEGGSDDGSGCGRKRRREGSVMESSDEEGGSDDGSGCGRKRRRKGSEESPQASDAEDFLDWLMETEAEWDAEGAAAAAAAAAGGGVVAADGAAADGDSSSSDDEEDAMSVDDEESRDVVRRHQAKVRRMFDGKRVNIHLGMCDTMEERLEKEQNARLETDGYNLDQYEAYKARVSSELRKRMRSRMASHWNGVSKSKWKKWDARYRGVYVGVYGTEREAACAYNNKVRRAVADGKLSEVKAKEKYNRDENGAVLL